MVFSQLQKRKDGTAAIGEDECRAWTIPVNTRAVDAAGAIHSDLSKHFIRAETIRWDQLLDTGSEANARSKGILRLERQRIYRPGRRRYARKAQRVRKFSYQAPLWTMWRGHSCPRRESAMLT